MSYRPKKQDKNKHASLGCCGFFSSDPFGNIGLRRPLRGATTPATFSFNSCPAPPPSFRLPSLFFFLLPWLNLRIQVALAIVLYFRRSRQLLANKKHSKSNVTFFVPSIQTSFRFQLRSQERFRYYAEKPSKVAKQADCN